MPEFAPLPKPLYAETAKAMLTAVEEQVKAIRASSKRIPTKRKMEDGSEVVISHHLEPEAIEAIRQWDERKKQINRALAG